MGGRKGVDRRVGWLVYRLNLVVELRCIYCNIGGVYNILIKQEIYIKENIF